MAKQMYIGISNIAHKAKKTYIGDENNRARKVKKMYIGDENNKARLFFSSGLGLIAGGQGYYNYYSENATSWKKSTTLSDDVTGYAAAYGNGVYVVVGGGDSNMYSVDGMSWTAISALSGKIMYDVAFCKDRFVAVGDGGVTYYSLDGISWTAMTTLGNDVISVCYNPDHDVIAACFIYASGSYAKFAYCTRDTMEWTIASTHIYSSSSGINGGTYHCLAWDGMRYVVGLSTKELYYNVSSTLASTWVKVSYASPKYAINRVVYLKDLGRVAVLGVGGMCLLLNTEKSTSEDWSITNVNYRNITDIIEYNGNIYICVHSNNAQILKRVDNSWQEVLSNTYASGNYVYFNYLCHGQD